jgi:hypothetical protein
MKKVITQVSVYISFGFIEIAHIFGRKLFLFGCFISETEESLIVKGEVSVKLKQKDFVNICLWIKS